MIYAVKSVNNMEVNALYDNWEDCRKVVFGKPAVYKSFKAREDAIQFFKKTPVGVQKSGQPSQTIDLSEKQLIVKFLFLRYQNESNGFTVATYRTKDGKRICCNGYYLPQNDRLEYVLDGTFKTEKKYGVQFEVVSYKESITDSKNSIVAYLSSGIIAGVGEKKAEAIYDVFQDKTIEILEKNPEELVKVKGISKKTMNKIVESYQKNKLSREITTFLLRFGIPGKYGMQLFSRYGSNVMNEMKNNPYILCDCKGLTFLDADRVAKDENYPMDSLERFTAAVWYVLFQNERSGSTGMPQSKFGEEMKKILGPSNVTEQMILQRVIELIKSHSLRTQKEMNEETEKLDTFIISSFMYQMEESIAKNVIRLKNDETCFKCSDFEQKIKQAESQFHIQLDPVQKNAVKTALTSGICIITGPPGTGKTTITQLIDYLYCNENKHSNPVYLAPTGRAARKLAESIKKQASTIQSYLKMYDGKEQLSEITDPVEIKNTLVLADEFSMTDVYVMEKLMNAIQTGCNVVLVGDKDQLPSVGPGEVLKDLIESGAIPVVRLDQIYRQGKDTQIYLNSRKINKGITDIKEGSDFHITICESMEEVRTVMAEKYVYYEKKYGKEEVMCLCPVKENAAGVKDMNSVLQDKINPADGSEEFLANGYHIRTGDLIMTLKNTEQVSNGDIGVVTQIEKNADGIIAVVDINDKSLVYKQDEFNQLTLAYSTTVHKSQGGEAKAVITTLMPNHKRMLYRNIPFVAISRAKENVEFVGSVDALNYAIKNKMKCFRFTMLKKFLMYYDGQFVKV